MICESPFHLFIWITILLVLSEGVKAQSSVHWVGTWATAPIAAANIDDKLGAEGLTLREIVHVSIGGSEVRVILTNEFGLEPLTIEAAQVALSNGGASVSAGSSVPLTFSGRASITIPPGAFMVSDPAPIQVAPLSDLAISLFLPDQPISQWSLHNFADQTNYSVTGNAVTSITLTTAKSIYTWDFLKGVDVAADAKAATIVILGDSIADGFKNTRDANMRWPDQLAKRLQTDKKTAQVGVLNLGISGNRVLHDGVGQCAITRFDRDVLAQAGVKYLIILEGINDIGRGYNPDPKKQRDAVTADDLISGYEQLILRAHLHGIKVYGATLTPYMGATYASPEGEKVRQNLNAWLRTSPELDGFIDLDKATSDPAMSAIFSATYDSGDHLHPNDTGAKAIAAAINVKLFVK